MAKYLGPRCIPTPEGEWDKTKEYQGLSIVSYEKTGDSYTSKKTVPAGTELTNEEYWMVSGRYNAQMELIKIQLQAMQSIPEGGTTADAALENIRIGADGTEYATPGDAVRGQVGALSEEIDDFAFKVKDKFYESLKYIVLLGGVSITKNDITVNGNSIHVSIKTTTGANAFYFDDSSLLVANRTYYIYYDIVAHNNYNIRVRSVFPNSVWGSFSKDITQTGTVHSSGIETYTPTQNERIGFDIKDTILNEYDIVIKIVDITEVNENDIQKINFSKLENGKEVCILKSDGKSIDFYSKWTAKEATFIGDSLTASGSYIEVIKSLLGLKKANNMGVGGECLIHFCARYNRVPSTSDIICIMGGTNDYSQHIPIGTNESTPDNTTYKGAIKYLIKSLGETYPNSELLFITPPYRDAPVGKIGTVRAYVTAMQEVCKEVGMKCISPYENIGINEYNLSQFSTDGTHYNWNGYKKLGTFIGENM